MNRPMIAAMAHCTRGGCFDRILVLISLMNTGFSPISWVVQRLRPQGPSCWPTPVPRLRRDSESRRWRRKRIGAALRLGDDERLRGDGGGRRKMHGQQVDSLQPGRFVLQLEALNIIRKPAGEEQGVRAGSLGAAGHDVGGQRLLDSGHGGNLAAI